MTNMLAPNVTHTEIWYEIQYSQIGVDDWFTSGSTADTIESARAKLTDRQTSTPDGLEYRIVRKTLVEDVVS